MNFSRGQRQAIIRISLLTVLLTMSGCDKSKQPAKVLCAYWQAVFNADMALVYKNHCLLDQAVISQDEFTREMELTMKETSQLSVCQLDLALRIDQYRFLGDDTVEFDVSVTFPMALGDKFKHLFIELRRDSSIVREGRPDLLTRKGVCRVVKENGRWLVFGNWEGRRRQEAEKARQRLEYLPQIKIGNIVIHEYQNVRRYYLQFNVYNMGSRALTHIRILLIFLTREKKPCEVLEQTVMFESSALKPQQHRSVKLDIMSMPVNWALEVKIRVVDCGFK